MFSRPPFLFALLITLLFSFFYALDVDRTCEQAACRGDFPAFYAAGVIAGEGQGELLYDKEAIAAVQNKFWPSLSGEYLFFAYPPFVAEFLKPIAFFSPKVAKGLVICLSLLFLAASVSIVKKTFELPLSALQLFTLALFFGPILMGVVAGQNIAFSIFLFSLLSYLLVKGGRQREFLAGFVLGAMLYKPQFAGMLLLFLLFARFYYVIPGFLLTGLAFNYLSNLQFGLFGLEALVSAHWLQPYLAAVQFFAAEDLLANGFQMVSVFSFFEVASREFRVPGLVYAGYVPAGLLLLLILKEVRTSSAKRLLALFSGGIILLSPHALFYDLGLMFLPFLSVVDVRERKVFYTVFFAASFLVIIAKDFFPVSPLFVVGLIAIGRIFWERRPGGRRSQISRRGF